MPLHLLPRTQTSVDADLMTSVDKDARQGSTDAHVRQRGMGGGGGVLQYSSGLPHLQREGVGMPRLVFPDVHVYASFGEEIVYIVCLQTVGKRILIDESETVDPLLAGAASGPEVSPPLPAAAAFTFSHPNMTVKCAGGP